jgi:DNA-binding NarL/FixJ family response regulator
MTERKTLGPSPVGGGPVASSRRGPSSRPLSPKQLEVLTLAALGRTQKQIASAIGIDIKGVGGIFQEIFRKLDGASTTAQAVYVACQRSVLPDVREPDHDDWPTALLDVLQLVAEGYTNAEIARRLSRSENTVIDQVQQARRRLGARDRAHASALAVSRRLIRIDTSTADAA